MQMYCSMTCRRTICVDIQAHSAHMCDSSSSGSVGNTLASQKAFHIDHLNLSVLTFLTFIGVLLSGRLMSTTNLSLVHSLSTFSFYIHWSRRVVHTCIVLHTNCIKHVHTYVCTQSNTARSILVSKVSFPK